MQTYAEAKLSSLGRWVWVLRIALIAAIVIALPPLGDLSSGDLRPITSRQAWALVAAGGLGLLMLGVLMWMIFWGLTNGIDNTYRRVDDLTAKVEDLEALVEQLSQQVGRQRDA